MRCRGPKHRALGHRAWQRRRGPSLLPPAAAPASCPLLQEPLQPGETPPSLGQQTARGLVRSRRPRHQAPLHPITTHRVRVLEFLRVVGDSPRRDRLEGRLRAERRPQHLPLLEAVPDVRRPESADPRPRFGSTVFRRCRHRCRLRRRLRPCNRRLAGKRREELLRELALARGDVPEERGLVCRDHRPSVSSVDLALELAGTPTTIADEDEEVVSAGLAQRDQRLCLRQPDREHATDDLLGEERKALARVKHDAHRLALVSRRVQTLAVAAEPDGPRVGTSAQTDKPQGLFQPSLRYRQLEVLQAVCRGPVQNESNVATGADLSFIMFDDQNDSLMEVLLVQDETAVRRRQDHRAPLYQRCGVRPAGSFTLARRLRF
mmetsp:Transcript_4064/g.12350  ORF Transcript_4064/g.12350 Transcript_4064/m.12350 type:complete len:377 (-) Transcript_4064:194-1324(-)